MRASRPRRNWLVPNRVPKLGTQEDSGGSESSGFPQVTDPSDPFGVRIPPSPPVILIIFQRLAARPREASAQFAAQSSARGSAGGRLVVPVGGSRWMRRQQTICFPGADE